MKDRKQQARIVSERLSYHFANTVSGWNIPNGMPFMNEFLNEVDKLCKACLPPHSEPQKVYALYQTDPWKSRKSKVLFGVFSSLEAAVQEAKENDVFYLPSTEIDIVEVELDKFEEV